MPDPRLLAHPADQPPAAAARAVADPAQDHRTAAFLSWQASGWRTARVAFPLAAIIIGALLWMSAGVLTFQDDAAQYISTARHLLQGDGALTSVLYYDSQLVQQAPAVQTVWPAGFPAVSALVAQVSGLSVDRALLLVAIGAHIGTALMLGLALRLLSMNSWLVLAVAGFWLMSVPSWLSVTRGLSDPLYQFFALACAVAVVAGFRQSGPLQAFRVAGLMAVAALLVRYQAVALLAPLALAVSVKRRDGQSMAARLRCAAWVAIPFLVVLVALFWRNLTLTGSLTGGAVSSRGQSLAEVAARIGWVPESLQFAMLLGLIASCVVCLVLAARLWLDKGSAEPPVRALMVYCLSAYAANIGLLLTLCLSSTVYSIEMRYMGVSLLFLVLPLVVALGEATGDAPGRAAGGHAGRSLAQGRLAGVIALVTFAQLAVLQAPYLKRLEQAPPTLLSQILAAHPLAQGSALSVLRGSARLGANDNGRNRIERQPPVLMSTHAHSLALLTDSTVIGVPVPVYTDRAWREEQIRALATRHGVDYIVAFRGLDTWIYRDLINQMMDTNHCPDWLQVVVATPELVIARLAPRDGAMAGGSQSGLQSAPIQTVTSQSAVKSCKLPIPPPLSPFHQATGPRMPAAGRS